MLTRKQRRDAHSLLGLPVEIRLLIAELVLENNHEVKQPLRFTSTRIHMRAHPLLHTCRILRYETEPLFYSLKPVVFESMNELRKGLDLMPSHAKHWTSVRISGVRSLNAQPGPRDRRQRVPVDTPDALLEPGLELLTEIPMLKHICVDIGFLEEQFEMDNNFDMYKDLELDTTNVRQVVIDTIPRHKPLERAEILGLMKVFDDDGPLNDVHVVLSRELALHDGRWPLESEANDIEEEWSPSGSPRI